MRIDIHKILTFFNAIVQHRQRRKKLKRVNRMTFLLAGNIRKTLTEAETEELHEWAGSSKKNLNLFNELNDPSRIQLALELLEGDE